MIASLAIGLALIGPAKNTGAWKFVPVSPGITVTLPPDASPITLDQGNAPGQRVWSYAGSDATYRVCSRPLAQAELASTTPDLILGKAVIDACRLCLLPWIKLQRDILFNGWPGLEAVVVDDFGPAQAMRTYVVGKTLYTLSETYSRTIGRPVGVDTFLTSLVLTPRPPAGPQRNPRPSFTTFQPPDGRFSIGMPATPTPMPAKMHTRKTSTPQHDFAATYGNRYYVTAYFDLPPDAPAESEVRATVLRDFLHGDRKRLLKTSTFTRDGHEYSSVEISGMEQMGGRVDITVVGSRVFLVTMFYPTGHAGSKDIEAFFGSFIPAN